MPEIYAAVERRTSPRDGLESSHGHPPLRRRRRLHGHARCQGNQLAVFTDAREIPEEQLQPLARGDQLLGDGLRLQAGGRGPRSRPDLHADLRAAVRRPSGARDGVRARPGRFSSRRSASRPAPGSSRSRSTATSSGRIVFGRMSQPIPKIEAVRPRGASCSQARRHRAARSCRSSSTTSASGTSTWACRARRPSRRSSPTSTRSCTSPAIVGVNCFAGSGNALEEPDVRPGRRRRRGSGDRLRRRPARRPPGPPRPHRLRRGDRDHPGRRDRPPEHALRPGRGHAEQIEKVECGGSAVIVARGEFSSSLAATSGV